jgi:FMN phosphatase YigB (HAD superfamily)
VPITELKAVFFDIGGTLGTVTNVDGRFKLLPYQTSSVLLSTFSTVLGLRTGIITNTPNGIMTQDVRTLLADAGLLNLLDASAIITSLDAKVSKPKAGIYEYAAKQVGLTTSQCLYIGEDPDQIRGALTAGMMGLLKPVPP